ncbi:hypothetical protein ACFB49_31160 [Sphingomonas sp. DBB INV C78]|uniref:hypothetical protein n=1 Tax=Sphingomonas sp. DBB INV C78 TaxID=3349434 RepID=UPI0036D3C3AD
MNRPERLACDLRRDLPVRERLAHLIPRKQQEIERAVRLLRCCFEDRRKRSPKKGVLHRLMIVGEFARRSRGPDRETGQINEYELWAFVDFPQYRGRNRHWGKARHALATELAGRATVDLSVFTSDEVERWRDGGNRFLAEKFDRGLVLWERSSNRQEAVDHD